MKNIRTYSELLTFDNYIARFNYLKLDGLIGESTFGYDRYLNQKFYNSVEWKQIRDHVIVRDCGCDLAIPDRQIIKGITVHHMNPMMIDDILNKKSEILNPEFLICVSTDTHRAIHYGDENLLVHELVERKQNDTCPWR